MPELPYKACWSAQAAREILQTEALANREGAFLAVHQSITNLAIGGARASDVDEGTDEGVLQALALPENRHVFCVVEGEPGSGKSHLIRWMKVKWPKKDMVLLIQRADGSLPGALRELKNALGGEYGNLFDQLGQRLEASFEGRVHVFQRTLAASMAEAHFEQPLEDAKECGKHDLARLLDSAVVQERWKGPERVLKIMAGMGGQRDQAVARFNLYDIAELGQLEPAVRDCPPRALMFLRKLRHESRAILAQLEADDTPDQVLADLKNDVPYSCLLMEALNRRRDYGVQNVLGISMDGLKEIFLTLRRRLKNEERRLVLLLEDITAWEGLDSQLIDVLVTDSTTRQSDDLCDLISVVGLTPNYMNSLRGNYIGRITHRVTLGREGDRGQFLETSQLLTSESREHFAANYLRAIRVGLTALDEWRHNGARQDQIPNRCDQCPVRLGCHQAFGASEGVGLYPLTSQALTTMYEALSDPSGRMTLKTPRGMIQGVLGPVLLTPSTLDDRIFPPSEVESSDWLPQEATRVTARLEDQLSYAASNEPEIAERLRRLVTLWGAPGAQGTTLWDEGLAFAEIPAPIFESFGLPWPGEVTATPAASGTISVRTQVASEIGRTDTTEELGQSFDPPALRRIPSSSTPRTAQPATHRSQGSKTASIRNKWQAMVQELTEWRSGGRLGSLNDWEGLLNGLVRGLPRHRFDVSDWLFDRVFTENNIKFEGERKSDVRNFVVPKEKWLILGLEAHVTLLSGSELQADVEEACRRLHSRMLRRLAELAQAHLERRLLALDGGEPWQVAGNIAQILLARAWLRGDVKPDQPLAEQFVRLLSDEGRPTTNPTDRVNSWNEVLTKTDKNHKLLRENLRSSLSLRQGEGRGYGVADAGAVVRALLQMQESLRLSPTPREVGAGLDAMAQIIDLVKEIDGRLKDLPRYEGERLKNRGQALFAMMRGRSLSDHVERIDHALVEVSQQLPQAAPDAIKDWKGAYTKAKSDNFFDDNESSPAGRVEAFLLDSLEDNCSEPELGLADKLAKCIEAPAGDMRQARDLLTLGESAIKRSYDYALEFIGTAGTSSGNSTRVRQFGLQVQDSAAGMLTDLEKMS